MARISIIVPIYNVESYLSKCLDSLVSQTFQDIEIICINDGSTDNSPIILHSYATRYPHLIRVFNISNQGLSGARNEGLKHATGEFICFIDSDDWIDLNLLENWIYVATKDNCDVVLCGIQVVNEIGAPLYNYGYIHGELTAAKVSLETNEACNKLYHRDLLGNELFPEGRWYEDLSVIPIVLSHAKSIGQVKQYGYYYLQRKGAITKTYDKRVLDICLAFDELTQGTNWSEKEYACLFTKHMVYTLIRIGFVPTLKERFQLYKVFYEYTISKDVVLLKKLSKQEGKNAAILVALFIAKKWLVLDFLLHIEIKSRCMLENIKNNIGTFRDKK